MDGIEDVDVSDGALAKAVQCKYYEGTKLTNSVLRDIVEPMLKDDKTRASKITYFVYGYFKEKVDFPLADAVKFKNNVLAYTKTEKGKKVSNIEPPEISFEIITWEDKRN